MGKQKLSGKEETKLLGVHLPPDIFNYVSLYTLAKGITKSKLFKGFIDVWMEEEKETEASLLDELVERIQTEWRKEKKTHPRANFAVWLDEIKKELSKGLTPKQVKHILANFE